MSRLIREIAFKSKTVLVHSMEPTSSKLASFAQVLLIFQDTPKLSAS